MSALAGKVAFITGAAHGQGRAHALRLAAEGVHIVATDLGTGHLDSVPYPLGTEEELAETGRLVKESGGEAVTALADVRDQASLDAAVALGVETFGRLDIVLANAGIMCMRRSWEYTEEEWLQTVDVNLNGVWRTTKAAIPAMIEAGNGGSIVLTGSTASDRGFPALANYVVAKHGVIGLMRTLANELAEFGIRCNAVLPTNVGTNLILANPEFVDVVLADRPPDERTVDGALARIAAGHLIDSPYLPPEAVSTAIAYLCSEDAKYMTGHLMRIDCGLDVKSF